MLAGLYFLPFVIDGQYPWLYVVNDWSVFGGLKNDNDNKINSCITESQNHRITEW